MHLYSICSGAKLQRTMYKPYNALQTDILAQNIKILMFQYSGDLGVHPLQYMFKYCTHMRNMFIQVRMIQDVFFSANIHVFQVVLGHFAPKNIRNDLQQLFQMIDTDGSGTIESAECLGTGAIGADP